VLLATYRAPGLVLREHEFAVPLDHTGGRPEQISVFAREVVAPANEKDDLPWLVFFQGGPGHEASRPTGADGWVGRSLEDFRLLLLDQRGTGRSTPATRQTLAGLSPSEQADWLRHFRADSIVRDAELIRNELGVESWSVLGQSFGGFCVTCYLSLAPEGLREALVTGGLPPLERPVDDVYRASYLSVLERNRIFYERYPDDRERVRRIVQTLEAHDVRLPGGDRLTPRRLRALGNGMGMSGGYERLHYLFERAFAGDALDEVFLRRVEAESPFEQNPIYALLHEAEYAQGASTRWSAARVLGEEFPQFAADPTLLTGEMVYPWTFEDVGTLRPLAQAAELLAQADDWPRLYDVARLQANEVPVAAAVYTEDMYVAYEYSHESAAAIRGLRAWETNEYQHNGLRADGARILGRLLELVRGEA
jgi:pimeloyl-ACP methyl ester carboxylesterase